MGQVLQSMVFIIPQKNFSKEYEKLQLIAYPCITYDLDIEMHWGRGL